jgi:hypothetical protein
LAGCGPDQREENDDFITPQALSGESDTGRAGGAEFFIFFAKVLHPSDTTIQICASLPTDLESSNGLRIAHFR